MDPLLLGNAFIRLFHIYKWQKKGFSVHPATPSNTKRDNTNTKKEIHYVKKQHKLSLSHTNRRKKKKIMFSDPKRKSYSKRIPY